VSRLVKPIVYYLAANPLHLGVYEAEAVAIEGAGFEVRFVLNARSFRAIPLALKRRVVRRGDADRDDPRRREYGPMLFHRKLKPLYRIQVTPAFLPGYLRGVPTILHARTLHVADAVIGLKKLFPKLEIVSELEGDAETEMDYVLRWGGHIPSPASEGLVRFHRAAERRVLEGSNMVLTVSEALRELLLRRHRFAEEIWEKVVTVPTVVSNRKFRFDDGTRRETRARLGLRDRYVVVYVGNLRAAWQQPEAMVELFSRIQKARGDAFLLVISPALEHKYMTGPLGAAGISHRDARILSASYDQIAEILCAADVGLLIRRQHLMNHVGSPAKLAEYLLVGLPVITTDIGGEHIKALRGREEILLLSGEWTEDRLSSELTRFCHTVVDSDNRVRLSHWATGRFSIEAWTPTLQKAYTRCSIASAKAGPPPGPTLPGKHDGSLSSTPRRTARGGSNPAGAAASGSKPMSHRILLVANTDWYLFNHRISLAEDLRRRGVEVHLASPAGPFAARLRQAGFPWHEVRMDRRGFNPIRELRTLNRVRDIYREVDPTLVHHFTIKPVLYGSLEGRWRGIPALVNTITGRGYIFAGRGIIPWLLRIVLRPVFAYALDTRNQKVVFQNPADREVFLFLRLVRPERCVLIRGSGIDPQHFSPRPEPEGVPVVLMPSRMLRDKGVQDLVEASRLLHRRQVRVRVVLAGEPDHGNPTSISEKRLRQWVAEGAVEWPGRSENMVETYAAAHIVVLPSHAEGVPRALIEASAMGKPIVATDLPGCREIVYNGRNGLLVPLRDPQALSDAIQTLVEDPALRRRMGTAGRVIALQNYTDEIVNGMILKVYDELLSHAGQPAIAGRTT